MKIALIAEWLDAWRGGAETSTLQFLHHLMEAGIELHVYTRSRPASTPGMTVHPVSGAAMSRTRRSMTFARRVERMLESESFDLVHAISPCRSADLYQPRGGTVAETIQRNLALRRNGAVRTLKHYANRFNVKQRYLLRLEQELLGRPDGPVVVAISAYVADQLRRHYGLPDERIRLVYNGVDPDPTPPSQRLENRRQIRKAYGIRPKDCLVLLVAHNFRLKGVRRWMEALALLLDEGVTHVRSLVIGKGVTRTWHRRAAQAGIAEHLTFVGPSDRVAAFRHAADVLVHPTYYDPCSRVVLEGMAAGLPVVTTRWDGAAEMIDDGRSGFILEDPWDIAALAQITKRLADADLRREIGRRAANVAAQASMTRHAEQMVHLYQFMCREKARA